jgi:thiol-disulfide isomerase/thioredoxin
MKSPKTAFLALILFMAGTFTFSQTSASTLKALEKQARVNVYYFHFNTRCATCRAVESEAQADVKELFGNNVSFASYNLDEKAGEAKGKELGVSGQTLLIVKGNQQFNITTEGFMYARTNPKKFRQIIEEKIKPLL